MAGILTLDTVENAEVEIGLSSGRVVRTGTVTDIPADASADSGVIFGALTAAGMPQFNSLYPGTQNLFFTRLHIRGFTTNGVKVALYYESFQALVPSAYIINDDSVMSAETVNMDLSTFTPLSISYGPAQKDSSGNPLPPDYASPTAFTAAPAWVDVLSPLRTVSVTTLSFGQPNMPGRDLFGGVNNATWPGVPPGQQLQGGMGQIAPLWTTPPPVGNPLGVGYWLLTKNRSYWSKYVNYFQTEVEATSYVTHDWSKVLIARNPSTGLLVSPSAAAVQALMIKPYTRGFQQSQQTPGTFDGFGRYGHYPLVNFQTVFGF